MKKIVFVLPSLKAGGAERVISFVAQNLDQNKYDVTLVVVGYEKDKVYKTDQVKTIFLNKGRLIKGMPTLVSQIIKFKPDIVVGTISHVNIFIAFLSLFFRRVTFIARESSILSIRKMDSRTQSPIYQSLIRIFYKKLSYIICQSTDMFIDFKDNYAIKPDRMIIINNPITDSYDIRRMNFGDKKIVQFVTVGRISREKGHERILKGLATIKNYNFHYTIIGNGALKDNILKLVCNLGLKSHFTHIPYTAGVLEMLSQMDVFLQGSYVEGFPNAALESCSVGTPVVAFNAPGGTKEIVEDRLSGFIVNDDAEFESLLQNKDLLLSLKPSTIATHVINKFNAQKIIRQYELLFDSV